MPIQAIIVRTLHPAPHNHIPGIHRGSPVTEPGLYNHPLFDSILIQEVEIKSLWWVICADKVSLQPSFCPEIPSWPWPHQISSDTTLMNYQMLEDSGGSQPNINSVEPGDWAGPADHQASGAAITRVISQVWALTPITHLQHLQYINNHNCQ